MPLETENRICLADDMMTIALKMSRGNPGALNVVLALMKQGDKGLFALLSLDTLGIYEHHIWMLYKDECKEDIHHMMQILQDHRMEVPGETRLKDLLARWEK